MIETGRKLLILTGIVVSGCATTEPLATFYSLDPGGVTHSGARQSAARTVRVYVNRVILPAYLNRTNLASFRNNQVEYSTSAFWAIPLDQAIAQAVARNLGALGVSAIGFQPTASPLPHSYEVSVRVTRCEGYDTGDVVLSGVWELRPAGDGRMIASKAFAIHRSGWQPGHYPSLASLLADEVGELSKQIASRIADSR
jgi:uncharacterized lipoprotein YmbA